VTCRVFHEDIDGSGEDEIQARGRLTLFDDVEALRVPLDIQVVAGIPQHRRLVGEQHEGMNEVVAAAEARIETL
jgi:hypothetical protein